MRGVPPGYEPSQGGSLLAREARVPARQTRVNISPAEGVGYPSHRLKSRLLCVDTTRVTWIGYAGQFPARACLANPTHTDRALIARSDRPVRDWAK